ncbi:hypothetical protein PROFUN_08804 [Planoprotostelium fungivorum]|uniref:RING-type domain-containing protein n=1 Tax=Planoprotostelium fungivorum TaxID=1890364 RepID=A0A2P6MVS0_9EUKA|nr:hypothetical protein PROFUN_08804 [Planoprotostelium fungivorum]
MGSIGTCNRCNKCSDVYHLDCCEHFYCFTCVSALEGEPPNSCNNLSRHVGQGYCFMCYQPIRKKIGLSLRNRIQQSPRKKRHTEESKENISNQGLKRPFDIAEYSSQISLSPEALSELENELHGGCNNTSSLRRLKRQKAIPGRDFSLAKLCSTSELNSSKRTDINQTTTKRPPLIDLTNTNHTIHHTEPKREPTEVKTPRSLLDAQRIQVLHYVKSLLQPAFEEGKIDTTQTLRVRWFEISSTNSNAPS